MIFVVYFGENICYTGYKDKKMTFAYCEKDESGNSRDACHDRITIQFLSRFATALFSKGAGFKEAF